MRTLSLSLLMAVAALAACSSPATTNNDMGGCTMVAGQCLFPPTTTPARTQCGDVTEFCDTTGRVAPNLDCIATPKVPPAGPAMVTLTGFVHAFSSGPDSKGVSIAVYDATALRAAGNPAAATPIATLAMTALDASMRACDSDGTKGCTIPSTTGCTLPVCADGLGGHPDNNKYCRDNGGSTECRDRLRWEARYSLPNIPTNKQLVIRSTGPNGTPDQTWATIFAWNVFLSTGDPACTDPNQTDCIDVPSGTYQLNVNALSQADYVLIPQTAGLSGGLPAGQSAVAGEVHDCDNIRVSGLVVGVQPTPSRFTYFNGNPVKTLPDPSRLATDQLGLYAALSIPPGATSVVAAGLTAAGGTLTSYGTFDALAFPDSVAVVNVNGGKPH
jgi:hypothetical protein